AQSATRRVPGPVAEPTAHAPRVAAELAAELQVMAGWLELDKVVADERGALPPAFRAALPLPRHRPGGPPSTTPASRRARRPRRFARAIHGRAGVRQISGTRWMAARRRGWRGCG